MSDAATLPRKISAIAIGASAGGAEALAGLLGALPARAALSVFVVLHLPRNKPSLLVEIFDKRCALRLREAEDKEPVEPGVVYFAPPDYHLLVDEGPTLALSVDDPVRYSRPSIDPLFESAAGIYGDRLLGIVLTGANDDGARGLRAVHDAGGLAVVQDPLTARAAYMPAAALRLVPQARVLGLNELSQLIGTARSEGIG